MAKEYYELPALISATLIERAKKLGSALLCDGMEKLGLLRNGCMDSSINPIDEKKVMVGTACTVDTEDGDNFPIHVALYQGKPGYVLVVAGKGYTERAYLGDLMCGTADVLGLSGIVVDGFVRDRQGIHSLSLPVFAKGIMQRSPSKKGPGKINTPVFCAGIEVVPGDLVVGDCDGVTVVPKDRLEEVLTLAEEKKAYEIKRNATFDAYRKADHAGTDLPNLVPAWVSDMLEK